MPKVIDDANVFRAVIDMLVSHGYEGATTKKIAEIARINEVTLFRKYGSKAELFEQAVNHQFSDTPLNKLIYTGNLEADLLAIAQAYIETNETHGEILPTLMIELPRYPELRKSLNTPWKNIQVLLDIIQQHQEQGHLKKEPLLTSISVLLGPLMVSQMFLRANPDLPIPTIDIQTHVDSFLHGRKP